MSNNITQAEQLKESLHLSLPPVAVAFTDDLPTGIASYEEVAPAGCYFWQEASQKVFSTSAMDHELCAIGVHTHNLAGASASHPEELAAALGAMAGLDYVREEEVAAIPVLPQPVQHAIYGPLSEFPLEADVVLLFAHAQQSLILAEAAARVDEGIPPAMGRPACAVVPQVRNGGRAAMSLGCCGARAYLNALSDDVALWALPGERLGMYCEEISGLAKSNEVLTVFHERRREDVAAGKRPSVQESLERLTE
ncbi:MAG: hypothetical protein F4148_15350 [Caldilineaceae bacterium SB0675_bin_29]|uniref:DUF169 domain-containing protein n=1 Tax=Caldilineaceae bacterium SB0675_bin_29 TaxID=2605266 RepID=A0A6B1G6T9_9CHLR|nr:hypothetical protein [Caldilineaceae bacterium SB0675_bin_29]